MYDPAGLSLLDRRSMDGTARPERELVREEPEPQPFSCGAGRSR